MSKRGYWGVALYEPKFKENIGTILRSAGCFNTDFIALIGTRFKHQYTDTAKVEKHVPVFEYSNLEDFLLHTPVGCSLIGVECDAQQTLENFKHPERCVYLFGGEDRSVPQEVRDRIRFKTTHCVNMAVAASIVMYDRHLKSNQPQP